MTTDDLFALPLQHVGDFEFDDRVVNVFPDMIHRSVPGYSSMLSMIEQLTRKYAVPESRIYDLGCSLGASTRLMRRQAPDSCKLIAVDNSSAMVRKFREQAENTSRLPSSGFDKGRGQCALEIREEDCRQTEIRDASVVVLNLTLQFIPPEDRSSLMHTIANGTRAGGALILSEKICFDDPDRQSLMTNLHHEFKRANGYSELEIAQKRTAIENRLVPETLEAHMDRLRNAGFRTVIPWFLCFNFASVVAVK